MINEQQKNTIIRTLNPYSPKSIGIFGSFARNENNHNSDLDILVDFTGKVNLLDIIGMEQDLTEEIGIKVDLVTKNALSHRLEQSVLKDLQIIY